VAELDAAHAKVRKLEREREAERAAVTAAAGELERARARRKVAGRTVDPRGDGSRLAELDAQVSAVAERLEGIRKRAAAIDERLVAALAEFGALADPVDEAARLAADTPVLLLPVRMETRFIRRELCVRVYPDQWAVDGFEERLATVEVESARRFWAGWWRAGGDEDRRRAAWRGLVASHGSGRGGWITRNHRPLNLGTEPVRASDDEVILVIASAEPPLDGERAAVAAYWEAVWRAGTDAAALEAARDALEAGVGEERAKALADQPPLFVDEPFAGDRAGATVTVAFCELPAPAPEELKEATWTQPARASVLPDRFVLLGFTGGAEVLREVGEPIPATLAVGPDPSAAPDAQLRIEDGELVVPDELRWMIDFDRAVEVGMGFRVPLSARTRRGIGRLMVLGLRVAAKPEESQADLERLLAHHHHSRTGLALVPQGTPTNNTESAGAGFDRLDDADASYDEWLGDGSDLEDRAEWDRKQDGQVLAEALGIDPELLATVPGAAGTDQAESRAANVALWPATWGYFLETMMHPILRDGTIEAARTFFTRYVSGRGAVPALRIGRQPYGILPTTAFSRLKTVDRDAGDGVSPKFMGQLDQLLERIGGEWAAFAAAVPHVRGAGDAHQTLLDILGAHPASVEFHQRYAESAEDLYNRLSMDGFGADFAEALEQTIELFQARTLLGELGWNGASPELLEKVFHSAQHRLKGPLVDDRPLSEAEPVRPYTDDGRNYLRWLADAAGTSLDALRRQLGFTGDRRPTALLYLLLRHGLLLSWWDAGLRFRVADAVLDDAELHLARREGPFLHVRDQAGSESRFEALYATEPRVTGDPRTTLAEFIPGRLSQPPARHLAEVIAAIERLADVPTARLERVLAEHLDCCSHRLDAWQLGLVHRRLHRLRLGGDRPRRGIHLGAYGWLENVRPEPADLDEVELPEPLQRAFGDGTAPLLHDARNGGFVHAPSLNHAATAAVLRSGYLANATPGQPGVMAVNLSSERMRLAVSVLQGLRQGQTLGALLGYRLERGLHDRHALAEVDRFIHELRAVFPAPSDRDGRHAIDGLDLLDHIQETQVTAYPFAHPDLPPASTAEAAAIDLEVGRLLDLRDALADLALAEGVHQAVLSNFDRAAATLDAFGKGSFPPEPAVLETPRTGHAITHRVGLHLRPGVDHATSPVPGVAMTPRAVASPAVNDMLARMLPIPSGVVVRVGWVDRDGDPGERVVTQAELGLQPIDLLALLQLGGQGMSELDERILLRVATAESLPPDVAGTATIRYTERVPGQVTLFEAAPLVAYLRSLVTRSRPLRPTDVVPPTEATGAVDAAVEAARARPAAVRRMLEAERAVAEGIVSDLDDPATDRAALLAGVDDLVDRTVASLRGAGAFGLPGTGWDGLLERRRELLAQIVGAVAEVVERWTRRLADADAQLAAEGALPSTATDEERSRLLLLAEGSISTATTDPVPADADATAPPSTRSGRRSYSDSTSSRRSGRRRMRWPAHWRRSPRCSRWTPSTRWGSTSRRARTARLHWPASCARGPRPSRRKRRGVSPRPTRCSPSTTLWLPARRAWTRWWPPRRRWSARTPWSCRSSRSPPSSATSGRRRWRGAARASSPPTPGPRVRCPSTTGCTGWRVRARRSARWSRRRCSRARSGDPSRSCARSSSRTPASRGSHSSFHPITSSRASACSTPPTTRSPSTGPSASAGCSWTSGRRRSRACRRPPASPSTTTRRTARPRRRGCSPSRPGQSPSGPGTTSSPPCTTRSTSRARGRSSPSRWTPPRSPPSCPRR